MPNWNPHATNTVGLEWPAGHDASLALASSYGRGVLIDAQTTETIDAARLFIRTRNGATTNNNEGYYAVDVYEAADVQPGSVNVAYSLPTALHPDSGPNWLPRPGGTVISVINDWPQVDEVMEGGADGALYINPIPGVMNTEAAGTLRFKCDPTFRDVVSGTTVSLANKRILNAEITGWFAALHPWPVTVQGVWSNSDTAQERKLYEGGSMSGGIVPNNTGQAYYKVLGLGGCYPWRNEQDIRPSDIVNVTTSGGGYFGIWCGYVLNGEYPPFPYSFVAYSVALRVTYAEERRLVVGYGTGHRSLDLQHPGDWVNFPLESPIDGSADTLSKTAGTQYMVVARQLPHMAGGNDWRGLDTATTHGLRAARLDGFANRGIAFQNPAGVGANGWGTGLPVPQSLEPQGTRSPALLLLNGGTARPDGSQPYARPITALVWAGASVRFVEADILETHEVEQDISNASGSYGVVTVVVRNSGLLSTITDPLTVRVRNGGTVLATVDIEPTAVDLGAESLGDGLWYAVRSRLPSNVSLGAGTIVEASSAADIPAWELLILSAEDAAAAAVGFRGTGDAARTVNGATVETAWWDAGMRVSTVPASLGGFGGTVEVVDVSHGLDSQCAVAMLERIVLGWTASGDTTNFAFYELERSDDGVTWHSIARLVDRTDPVFVDVEMSRNVDLLYRVRQVRNDDIASDWTTSLPIQAMLDEWVVVLASNFDPDLTVAYLDEPGYAWNSIDAERTDTRHLMGSDYGVMLRETEHRGETFRRNLIVGFNAPAIVTDPRLGGRAIFDPLLAVAHQRNVPYVAVADHRGRRWFTGARVTAMTEDEPGGQYRAEVEFTEVSGPMPVRS